MFSLAPHVQCCLADNHILLLDLKRGRYFGVPDRAARELRRSVEGLPRGPVAGEDTPRAAEVLEDLVSAGIVLKGSDGLPKRKDAPLCAPKYPLIHGYDAVDAVVTARHTLRFIRACTSAYVLLRHFSLETLSRRLTRRASRLALTAPDDPRLRTLVAAFHRLRPFLYTSHDACLFSSLAIHEFLALHGLRTQFVIGVAASPFKAHCWLQSGDTVVNDSPDHVWQYTPIMVR
jgi:hypothetical protein